MNRSNYHFVRVSFRRLSIQHKLIGLCAVMIVAIVGFLSVWFSVRQIRSLRVEQSERIGAYGTLLAHQLRSAIAFGDHETAREVLDTIDPSVVAVILYGDDGSELYRAGQPDAWVERVRGGVGASTIVHGRGRISVVEPVRSLEGPEGTLVVQMSNAASREQQRSATWLALWIGLGTLAVGVAAAWWIARSFTRRIGAIARVAGTVSRGDLGAEVVVDRSTDEIGDLATAFSHMLGQLRTEHQRLEQHVGDRTRELTAANEQLVAEMGRRAAIELELRQAQKLESVGRLASGVAHEINTPMQYVSDSIHFISGAITDVLGVLDAYRDGVPDAHAREDAADLPFLRENLPEALASATEGVDRVVTIVRSLKTFAHPDRAEMAPADLNAAITSTLAIARNEYKYTADVETSFAELPAVTCHLGEINQVVLNLVVNATHAIQDVVGNTGDKGKITVTTRAVDDGIEVEVADTGSGIPEAIQPRVFDPFFTTKEVGRGTGQGLAIARAVVVDKHRGRLTFRSSVGTGTTFTVFLPRTPGAAAELRAA